MVDGGGNVWEKVLRERRWREVEKVGKGCKERREEREKGGGGGEVEAKGTGWRWLRMRRTN